MNFGFGLATFIAPIMVVLFSIWLIKKTKKLTHGVIVGIIGMGLIASFSTYGPRVEVKRAVLPKAPVAGEIAKGIELIPEDDRWTHFDSVVKKHEERQDVN